MKKYGLSKSAAPAALCAGLCLTGTANAQLTPAQTSRLNDFFGDRAEVGIVLGASDSAGGGSYTVDGRNGLDDFEFSLFKFGGSAELGDARPLGNSGVMWNPYVFGTIGYISGDNDVVGSIDLKESALGINFGGGMALHLTERFTVTPYVGVIYGHYDVELKNSVTILDDTVDTIGATPGIGLAYKLPVGRNTLTFGAKYTFFGTTDIGDSDIEDAGGSSHILEQRIDADVPLNAELWGCRLHTGGYVSLTEALGDIGDSMNSDWWVTVHPRLLFDVTGKLWKMDRIGLGASYIKGDHFDGWDIGVDVSFKF